MNDISKPRWTGFGEGPCCQFVGQYISYDVWTCRHLSLRTWIVLNNPENGYYSYDATTINQYKDQQVKGYPVLPEPVKAVLYFYEKPIVKQPAEPSMLDGDDAVTASARTVIRRSMCVQTGVQSPTNKQLVDYFKAQPWACHDIMHARLTAIEKRVRELEIVSMEELRTEDWERWRDYQAFCKLMYLIDVSLDLGPDKNLAIPVFVFQSQAYKYLYHLWNAIKLARQS